MSVKRTVAKKKPAARRRVAAFKPSVQVETKVITKLAGREVKAVEPTPEHLRGLPDCPHPYPDNRKRNAWLAKEEIARKGRKLLIYTDCHDDEVTVGDLEEVALTVLELCRQNGIAVSVPE